MSPAMTERTASGRTGRPGQPRRWSALAQAILWRRALITGVLAAAAVAAALDVLAPDPPPIVRVVAAARDLAGGAIVQPSDVRLAGLPPAAVPEGALTDRDGVTGRVLAGPVRRGEPLTDIRFVGSPLLAGFGEGMVAAPVRLADPGIVAVLHSGDLVDILAARPPATADVADSPMSAMALADGGSATVVAAGVHVITVLTSSADPGGLLGAGAGSADSMDGTLVLIAATPQTAQRLAEASVMSSLSIVLRAN